MHENDNRSLSADQLDAVRAVLPSLSRRDRMLWLLSYHGAYRIHETLSVRIGDVWHDGRVRQFLTIQRRFLKGGLSQFQRRRVSSRTVPIHPTAAEAVREYLVERMFEGPLDPQAPLFVSQKGGGPIKSVQAWRIFQRIYHRAGLTGSGLGTHLTRRTAARRLYELHKDVELVRAALNHRNLVSTQHYIRMSSCEAAKAFLEL